MTEESKEVKTGMCGCMPYAVVMWIVVAIEVLLAITCVVTQNFFAFFYATKIIVLITGLTCCTKS